MTLINWRNANKIFIMDLVNEPSTPLLDPLGKVLCLEALEHREAASARSRDVGGITAQGKILALKK